MSPSVELFGESFRLVDEPSEWAMLEFAETASSTDAGELAGLAAIMRLLEASVHEDDWARFKSTARKNRAQIERDLMPVVVAVFTEATDRPTVQPSNSSGGLPTTAPSSTVALSSSMVERLQGRPDLYLFVEDAAAARSA